MDATTFQVEWQSESDVLRHFPQEIIAVAPIPDGARKFLFEAGLPWEAAPCLSFGPISLAWLQPDRVAGYYGIGSDGSGNPLVIAGDGVVWMLDHEGDRRTFVNSSVEELADCLLAYRTLVSETIATGGDDAFLSGFVPRDVREVFARSVQSADPPSLEVGTFWQGELSSLADSDS
ncbi:SUKH-4 family immunity protein [Sphingobium sp. 3R8]|uniref:SUKH-4 family immunity protein n=1 Tax=Sphingobium sp. 3R8 TaxID=2874921 RepID=UPI001CCC1F06|nr:SUKH-4 family immunity protein [Sphingobium sp. 3R8]MBZ9647183.1 SUKH-4 family immunity protein [Sphingobium sp. 3R8]